MLDGKEAAVARRRGRTVYTGPLTADWESGEAVSNNAVEYGMARP